jgi:prepilin-type processing-associated H-X9-DG protein
VKSGGTSAQFLMADGSVSSGTPLLTEADIEVTASTAGQTSFNLTFTPSSLSKVKMYINGIRISKTAYTISGSTLTYIPANNESYNITIGDRVQFEFAY